MRPKEMGEVFERANSEAREKLRDQFAMAALTGMLSNPRVELTTDDMTLDAYILADSMLEARLKEIHEL